MLPQSYSAWQLTQAPLLIIPIFTISVSVIPDPVTMSAGWRMKVIVGCSRGTSEQLWETITIWSCRIRAWPRPNLVCHLAGTRQVWIKPWTVCWCYRTILIKCTTENHGKDLAFGQAILSNDHPVHFIQCPVKWYLSKTNLECFTLTSILLMIYNKCILNKIMAN